MSQVSGKPTTCCVNRCGRPLGIGTHMSITGYGRASDHCHGIPVDAQESLL